MNPARVRLWVFGTAFLTGFSGAMMPGPMLAATLGGSLQRGFWAGPRVVLGHAAIEIALVACLAFGQGRWLRRRGAFVAIALVGGLMLLGMGASMIAGASGGGFQSMPEAGLHASGDVVAGMVTSASNPCFFLWWATVGLALIQDARQRGAGAGTMFCGHILSDLVWFSLVSFVVARPRGVLPVPVMRTLFLLCGAALVALGVWFLAAGIRRCRRTVGS